MKVMVDTALMGSIEVTVNYDATVINLLDALRDQYGYLHTEKLEIQTDATSSTLPGLCIVRLFLKKNPGATLTLMTMGKRA